jgi:hypothetical protein
MAITKTMHWQINAANVTTGNETLRDAVADARHFIRKIRVDMCPGSAAASFTINSATTAMIGPVDLIDTGTTSWEYEFLKPLMFGENQAINIDTEAADQIHVIIEGFTRRQHPQLSHLPTQGSASVSASISASLSASVSSSVSASISASVSASASISASVSSSASPS